MCGAISHFPCEMMKKDESWHLQAKPGNTQQHSPKAAPRDCGGGRWGGAGGVQSRPQAMPHLSHHFPLPPAPSPLPFSLPRCLVSLAHPSTTLYLSTPQAPSPDPGRKRSQAWAPGPPSLRSPGLGPLAWASGLNLVGLPGWSQPASQPPSQHLTLVLGVGGSGEVC